MERSDVQAVLREAQACAMAMLENASFVERELVNVVLPEDLLGRTKKTCSSLIGTKHDIITEVFETEELLAAKPGDTAALGARVERIVRWLGDDMSELHALVMALREAAAKNPDYATAALLVTESATNILLAYNRVRDAAVKS